MYPGRTHFVARQHQHWHRHQHTRARHRPRLGRRASNQTAPEADKAGHRPSPFRRSVVRIVNLSDLGRCSLSSSSSKPQRDPITEAQPACLRVLGFARGGVRALAPTSPPKAPQLKRRSRSSQPSAPPSGRVSTTRPHCLPSHVPEWLLRPSRNRKAKDFRRLSACVSGQSHRHTQSSWPDGGPPSGPAEPQKGRDSLPVACGVSQSHCMACMRVQFANEYAQLRTAPYRR